MLPILSHAQLRAVEHATIRQGASEVDLMEQAGRSCAYRIMRLEAEGYFGEEPAYHVIAGQGNNGGDGLVIARHLHENGRTVRVSVVQHRQEPSPGHRWALERAQATTLCIDHFITSDLDSLVIDNDIVIDSIIGCGCSAPLTGGLAVLVDRINVARPFVVAIDLPSGSTEPGGALNQGPALRARITLTIGTPKLGSLLPETGEPSGTLVVLPIDLDPSALANTPRLGNWIEPLDISRLLKQRPRFSHKGSFGHALLIAGGPGCYGAAILAARGCACSGVGLLTVHGTRPTITGIAAVVPDAMSSLDPSEDHIEQLPDLEPYTCVAIGPGMGRSPQGVKLLHTLFERWAGPLVIDADGLGLLADTPELLGHLNQRTILTPHPKEMDRLLGSPSGSGYERLERTRNFAQERGCVVVLKGAYTAVCDADGGLHYLPTGNPGMAKGGSGDVLTGVIAGVYASGYLSLEASIISTYMHGRAGDLTANALGMDAMRPSDLVERLPTVWQELRASVNRP
ncbi:MAG: NAD(P)H-hydrate dehydratase [Flavobacteriales bacterium]|nr:NAD(P)H-hydrate dehydratase [Flavobacteriales bacterium]